MITIERQVLIYSLHNPGFSKKCSNTLLLDTPTYNTAAQLVDNRILLIFVQKQRILFWFSSAEQPRKDTFQEVHRRAPFLYNAH